MRQATPTTTSQRNRPQQMRNAECRVRSHEAVKDLEKTSPENKKFIGRGTAPIPFAASRSAIALALLLAWLFCLACSGSKLRLHLAHYTLSVEHLLLALVLGLALWQTATVPPPRFWLRAQAGLTLLFLLAAIPALLVSGAGPATLSAAWVYGICFMQAAGLFKHYLERPGRRIFVCGYCAILILAITLRLAVFR